MEDPAAVRLETQSLLLDFLRADMDLAFTFLETAKIDTKDHPDHARELLSKVRRALESVRRLSGRLLDRALQQEIHKRADELESELRRINL